MKYPDHELVVEKCLPKAAKSGMILAATVSRCGASTKVALAISGVILKNFVIEDITGDLAATQRMAEQVRQAYDGEVIRGFLFEEVKQRL